jgi:uncharacterized protein (TIGR02996 family)
MKSLQDAFFASFQEEPEDDVSRLVSADVLEDTNEPAMIAHGQLIRVQIAIEKLPCIHRDFRALKNRETELLDRWEHVWLGDMADLLHGWAFRRGLLEAVHADASVFLEFAEQWLARWPTLSVAKLSRADGHLRDLARCPFVAHLRGLDLSNNGITARTLPELLDSQFLCLLRGLDLSGNCIAPQGMQLLVTASTLDDLRDEDTLFWLGDTWNRERLPSEPWPYEE